MDTQGTATQIVKTLNDAGYIAYFAGGCVRDFLMDHPSADIDIATNAPPEAIVDLFPKTITVGINFGVVIVVLEGQQFEVSTFRKDIESHGRRPEKIELSSPEEDAERRDFTINGMFYDPLTDQIHDFIGGKEGIKKRLIQTIGDPQERFYEDRLRMVRAIRFAARFQFVIDPDTEEAIIENAPTLFPSVAMERIFQELTKMCEYPGTESAFIQLHKVGLLPIIFHQLKQTHLNDIKSAVVPLPYFPNECPAILYIMELFQNAALEKQLNICHYLKAGNLNARLTEFVYKGKALIKRAKEEEIPLTEWTHFYANPHSELCLDIIGARLKGEEHTLFFQEHSDRIKQLLPHSLRIAEKKPLINGTLLKEFGVPAGKLMGQLMQEAESLAITHDLHEADPVMELLQKSPNWPVR